MVSTAAARPHNFIKFLVCCAAFLWVTSVNASAQSLYINALARIGANLPLAPITPPPNGNSIPVTNTNDSGQGSLRQAIIDSNNIPGAQLIIFQIPDGEMPTHTIVLQSSLPDIVQPVAIDGANFGVPSHRVEITGSGTLDTGLRLSKVNGCEIRNLVINGFRGRQILLFSSTECTIKGNYLGLNPAGTAIVAGSGIGVQ